MSELQGIREAQSIGPGQLLELLHPAGEVRPIRRAEPVEGARSVQQRREPQQIGGRFGGDQHAAEETDQARLDAAVEDVNAFLLGVSTDLRFRVDEDLDRVVVSIVDSTTGDVLRQVPPEEVLEIARRIAETGKGLVDSVA